MRGPLVMPVDHPAVGGDQDRLGVFQVAGREAARDAPHRPHVPRRLRRFQRPGGHPLMGDLDARGLQVVQELRHHLAAPGVPAVSEDAGDLRHVLAVDAEAARVVHHVAVGGPPAVRVPPFVLPGVQAGVAEAVACAFARDAADRSSCAVIVPASSGRA